MCKRFTLIAVLTGLVGCAKAPSPSQGADAPEVIAIRHIVAWFVEGKQIPGFDEDYPDAQFMADMKRFFVVCDFVPLDTEISSDPRVRRIAQPAFDRTFEKYDFDDTDYLFIELLDKSGNSWAFNVSNMFGTLAGHEYKFIVRRTENGPRVTCELLWVS